VCASVCVSVWRRCKCVCKSAEKGLGSGNAAKVCDIYPNKVGK